MVGFFTFISKRLFLGKCCDRCKKINYTMSSKNILALIGGVLVLAASVFRFYSQFENSNYSSLRTIVDQGYVDREIEPLLNESLSFIKESYSLQDTFIVNELSDKPGVIPVISVNLDRATRSGINGTFLRSIKENIVTVNGKYIIADSKLLRLFLLESYNDFSGSVEADLHTDNPVHTRFSKNDYVRTIFMRRMLRIGNAEYILSNDENSVNTGAAGIIEVYNKIYDVVAVQRYFELLETEKDRFESLLAGNGLDPMALPLFLNGLVNREKSTEEPEVIFPWRISFSLPYAATLSPFILHELGHIEGGEEAQFFESVEVLSLQELRNSVEVELRADQFALKIIDANLDELSRKWIYGDWNFNYSGHLYTTATIMSDAVFSKAFNGFRLLNAQSIGTQIYYRDEECEQSSIGFFDVNNIVKMVEVPFPLMTRDEVESSLLSSELLLNTTHPPITFRSMKLEIRSNDKYIKSYNNDIAFSSKVREVLFDAMRTSDWEKLDEASKLDFSRIYGELSGPGLESVAVLDIFKPTISEWDIEEPLYCPLERCTVLRSERLGTIELGVKDKRVKYVSLYLPNYSSRKKEKDGAWHDQSEDQTIRFVTQSHLISGLLKIDNPNMSFEESSSSSSSIGDLFLQFLDRHLKCGFSSMKTRGVTGTFSLSTVDNDKSAYLVYVSN